jgi:hypothetical protein
MAFTLEASAITFNPPQSGGKPDSSTACSGDWISCFSGVTASSAVVAPDPTVFANAGYPIIFVATPVTGGWNRVTTSYALSSTPLANNELLLKQIMVTNTDNLDNIVKGAGAGVAAGFAFGPVGAAVGGLAGASSGVNYTVHAASTHTGAPARALLPISSVVCPADQQADTQTYDYAQLSVLPNKKMSFVLPFVIAPGPSSTFFPSKSCWHPLPNNLRGYTDALGQAKRPPQAGDGWFYRIVRVDDDTAFTDPETGIKPAKTVPTNVNDMNQHGNDFPVSACRKVIVQITWWQNLSNYVNGMPTPSPIEALNYKAEIADPGNIAYVTLPRSGSINFKLVCGAYMSNNFTGPPLGTLATDVTAQVTAAVKAQPSASSKPAPAKK